MRKIRKALIGTAATLAAALGTAMLDGSLTSAEFVVAAGTALLAGSAVYAVPNRR